MRVIHGRGRVDAVDGSRLRERHSRELRRDRRRRRDLDVLQPVARILWRGRHWTTHSNRATNAPFAILDGATTCAQPASVNQQVAPADFSDAGVSWDSLGGSVRITSGTLVGGAPNDAANGRLNADAIRIERLPDVPEIRVSDGTTSLVDGVSTIDVGETPPGVPATRVLTVENVGAQTLVLDEPITVSDGFSLAIEFSRNVTRTG